MEAAIYNQASQKLIRKIRISVLAKINAAFSNFGFSR